MSERFKYANNGIYICEDFAQHVAAGEFPSTGVAIGSVGGISGWRIKMRFETINNQSCVYPLIFSGRRNSILRIRFYFNCLKSNGSSSPNKTTHMECDQFLAESYGVLGDSWSVQDILAKENDYLNDGAISVEYGIQVDVILGTDDALWKFNFHDKLYEGMMFFHSSDNKALVNKIWCKLGPFSENFLQISKGIHIHFDDSFELFKNVRMARHYKLYNVVHYCEFHFLRHPYLRQFSPRDIVKCNLRHVLAALLRYEEGLGIMLTELKEVDFDVHWLSGETMKMLVGKILEREETVDLLSKLSIY